MSDTSFRTALHANRSVYPNPSVNGNGITAHDKLVLDIYTRLVVDNSESRKHGNQEVIKADLAELAAYSIVAAASFFTVMEEYNNFETGYSNVKL